MTEQAVGFACHGDALVGVLSAPETIAADVGVVIVVGGPQYRAGSHRQFVQLARALAAGGFPVLRFDVRGMGDSEGEPRSFEALSDDIAAAIDAMQQQLPAVRRVVLWGLCDGASAALLYVDERADPRVRGLCLVNPWVRTAAVQARTQIKHYYGQRLLQPAFWAKLLRGQVAAAALRELWGSVTRARRAPAAEALGYVQRMCRGWQAHRGPVLLLMSANDYTAREFDETVQMQTGWQRALARPLVQRHDLAHADHTFSDAASRCEAEALTLRWLDGIAGAPRRAVPAGAERTMA